MEARWNEIRTFTQFIALLLLLAAVVWLAPVNAVAGSFETSAGFFFNKSNYGNGSYSWTRRWGASAGYHFTETSEIEFAFQDEVDRTKIDGFEDTTFHDRIYSVNWVQGFTGKTSFLQPYVKLGAGQLNREATGNYSTGGTPPSRYDSLTALVGLGLRVYITQNLGLRSEVTSYLTGARLGTFKDNVSCTMGLSVFF